MTNNIAEEAITTDDAIDHEQITVDEAEESSTNAEQSEEELSKDGESKDKEADGDQLEEDDVVVTIGDSQSSEEDSKEKDAPPWVTKLRQEDRRLKHENKKLREQLEALQNPAPAKIELGAKPKLEDFDYDAEIYEQKLTQWYDTKRKVEAQEADIKAEEEAQKQAWETQLSGYSEQKQKLKFRDYDLAEEVVSHTLDETQQGIIITGAENSALIVYALGKNPEKAEKLSSIKDPIKFAFAVARLEKELKVTNRKAPPPEKIVKGTNSVSGSADTELERLREEASKTGNYSKVLQYKRKLKAN